MQIRDVDALELCRVVRSFNSNWFPVRCGSVAVQRFCISTAPSECELRNLSTEDASAECRAACKTTGLNLRNRDRRDHIVVQVQMQMHDIATERRQRFG